MEVRADSMIVRDQVEGAIRWTAPAHATIDVVGSHEEHTFGLINGAQLLDVDTDGRARVWTRVSMVPPYPASCFQIRGSLIGEWTDGAASESFEADGRYLRGDARGNWSIPEVGTLEIALGMRVRRYRIALAAPDMLVTAVEGPLLDEDPRGDSSIETRVR